MLTLLHILLYSVVCYLAAVGIQNKLIREGGPLDFVHNWVYGTWIERSKLYTLLFGCEVCLGGQIFMWSWLAVYGLSWWWIIGTLTCVGVGYVISEKFLFSGR